MGAHAFRAGKKALYLFALIILFALGPSGAHAVPPGTIISNFANAAFDDAGSPEARTSNTVDITTTLSMTPSDIEFFQYSPTGVGATPMVSSPSGCSLGGPGGPFPPLGNPTYPGIGVLDTSLPVDLIATTRFHQGEPVFIEVRDANRNIDRDSRDTVHIMLDVAENGDLEQLELSETGVDTGIFVGYIQSVAPAATAYDCQLAISEENIIRASYVDYYDSSDTASDTALVDPFGIVFDSATGNTLDGATVTILDAVTGLPAQVFGDDGISSFPSTVTSGGTATDSSGALYNFPPGGYRFPLMAPGAYRLEVSAANYTTPSTRTIAELQALPDAPYALDSQASFGNNFVVVAGPPLNIDLPADPIPSELFLTKSAGRAQASIGDFVVYTLELTNNQNLVPANNAIIRDVLPVGFRYQKDSVQQKDGSATEPAISGDGRTLTFSIGNLPAGQSVRLSYVLEVTAGTKTGDAVNKATASDAAGTVSNTARAIVFIEDDLLNDRSFIFGRVMQGNCEVEGPAQGTLKMRMQTASQDGLLGQTLNIAGEHLADQQLALAVELPGVLQYEQGSVRINGRQAAEPETRNGTLWFTLADSDASGSYAIEYRLTPRNPDIGEFTIRARAVTQDQDGVQQSTAWAVNAISRPATGKRFTVSGNDSGELAARILNTRRYNHEPTVGTDLAGVPGIRLIMEDGRYVITDEKGLYHFEGLEPGTHVVQVDPDSIPAHLEIFECEQNTRFAGDAHSQFADLQGGLIWRSDFYVREKAPLSGNIGIRLESSLDNDAVEYRVTLAGDTHKYRNLRATIMLAEGLEYVPGSARLDAAGIADPAVNAGILTFKLGDRDAADWTEVLTFRASATPAGQGELSTQAILAFDNGEQKNRRTRPAVNSLRYQHDGGAMQHYEYQAWFDSLKSTLQPRQRKALMQFINGLADKGIDKVTVVDHARITGHADNVPIAQRSLHIHKDNQTLSLARAATVGKIVRDILGLEQQQIIIVGMGESRPVADNSTDAGRAHNRRAELVITISEERQDAILETGRDDSGMQTLTISKPHAPVVSEQQEKTVLPPANETVSYDRNWLDTAAPGLEWLAPAADYIPEIPSIRIAIKHDADNRLELVLNGQPVDAVNFDGITRSTDKTSSITRWSGVDVEVGDNLFEVTAYDKAGAVTATRSQVIHYSGMPVKAEFVEQYSQLQANGMSPVVVAVRFYDRWGKPVRKGVIGKYRLNPPYTATQTVDAIRKQPLSGPALGETTYRIDNDGVALIGIEPTTQSGKATLVFKFDDNPARIPSIKRLAAITKRQEQEVTVWLQGTARDWILVGLAEGTAGYNSISGNQAALDDSNTDEHYYQDDRLAFYAKGRIKGEFLLTLAYDSENQTDASADQNSLFQTINPDKYYTLYGDATEQYFDAASSDQLYVRLEREQFYAMYGDFNTELTVTELSRYSRSMTGLKTEYEGERFGANAFAAEIDQQFVRDEILGNGTSGLYHLSEDNVVINSDKVSIETRDRFQSQHILEKRELTRFIDYNIDIQKGTLFFKQPVPSKDSNFNPIYIVADYEVTGADGKKTTGGGRGYVKFMDDRLEIGATAIHQGDIGTGGDLAGGDLRFNITDNTELRAEIAGSNTKTGGTDTTGKAWLAEAYHNSERTDARLYYRKQEEDFGLGQQNNSDSGTKRYGVDARYLATDNLYLNGEAYHDEVLTTNTKRDVVTTGVEYHHADYVMSTGLAWAKDRLGNGETNKSTLLTANASRAFLDNRLNLHTGTELALGNDENVDYPTRYIVGGDYRLHENVELFAEQEFTSGEEYDSNTTRVGFRSTPWHMASINSSLEQQATENGLRLFSNLGLTQGFQVNEHLLIDFGIDRSQTLNDSGLTPFNADVPLSSGSVDGDFNAVFLGSSYTKELWSATSRVEYRNSDQENQRGLFLGLYRQHTPGMGLSMAAQLFDTDSSSSNDTTSADVRFSLAYRPVASHWIVLDRLDLNFEDTHESFASIRNRKIVNNLNLNYLYDRRNQVAVHHGIKYANVTIEGKDYNGITQVLGAEYRHDINARWDAGIHGSILHSTNSNVYRYSAGPSVGMNLFRNVWLSVGYNFTGFEDDDFSSADYTAKGPYAKFRFKFGTQTVRELVSWMDK